MFNDVMCDANIVIHHLPKCVISSAESVWIENCPPYIFGFVATDLFV